MSLAILDLALRSAAIALLLLLAVLLLRDFRSRPAGWLAAAFALGAAVYAVSSAAGAAAWPLAVHAPLIAIASGNIVVFWLFACALFDDGFTPRWSHGAIWGCVAAFSLINCTVIAPAGGDGSRIAGLMLGAITLAFIAAAVVQSLRAWSTDLVERRRLLRLFIVAATALDGGVFAVLQLWHGVTEPTAFASAANGAVLFVIAAVVVAAMTRATGDEVFAPAPASAAERLGVTAEDTTDARLIVALNRLMQAERVYRQEGLTIGTVAAKLGLPEYRLRRLINQKLGYRNFSAFLNGYRLAEVKAALADPTQAEVPVTTIAFDAGFQSLGPFNRAFKTETGLTPTEFRRARLAVG